MSDIDTHTSESAVGAATNTGRLGAPEIALGVLRIALGWVLLWAGLDKVFALGYSTQDGQGVIDGASATEGYLTFGLNPDGPAYDVLSPLAGNPLVDLLYLAGTLGAGLAILLGVVTRIAAAGAAVLMVSLWFSALPLEHNPFFDEHLFYAIAAVVVMATGAGNHLGLGRWWRSTGLVRSNPWLA